MLYAITAFYAGLPLEKGGARNIFTDRIGQETDTDISLRMFRKGVEMEKIHDGKKQVLHKEVLRHRKRIPLRWRKFAQEYFLSGFKNASESYRKAYGEEIGSSEVQSSRLLANARFQEYFAEFLEKQLGEDKAILSAKVVQKMTVRAFYDPADIINDDGSLRHSMEELSAMGLSYAIDGIERTITKQGDEIIRVRLADRQAALESLAKYLRLIQQGTNVELNTQKSYQFVVIQRMTADEWDKYYEQKMQKIYGSPNPDKPKQ
jgi:hypothetical protein